jgi:putative transposase
MMELSQSSLYYDPKITRAEKEEQDADLRHAIELIRVEQPRLGYRQLLPHLKCKGLKVGERKLRRVLKKFELQIRPRKRFFQTTQSDHGHPVYPNHIAGMTLDDINQVWASDITYIRITNGFVFLAVILDLYSRKVIGWQISKRIDGQLVLDALEMALQRRQPPKQVIHHSDRGVQYLCEKYVEKLKAHDFIISCSAKGNPYDNAFVESFMKTLKENEVYMWEYETFLDVCERVPHFIEEVYNRKRLHSSLEYQSPEEFEKMIEMEYSDKTQVGRPTLEI